MTARKAFLRLDGKSFLSLFSFFFFPFSLSFSFSFSFFLSFSSFNKRSANLFCKELGVLW